ncbi:hypothetical protein HBH56_006660 [Parastagonospora nodorum]|nr:hypothetical protein HBH56_006660 [Parastagonospora nodorum]KAH3938134.1 hypothetical protein HBH54_006650 [Parastagonospora nodorum]KAH3975141.1 hypothetical protein HBH51_089450 [Parastagonospora nodorum]KAH4020141.1 hypothetical protein HBI09_181140 [Parastagonospora nodorum]KAH4053199.1 hypothetical protein HBH49_096520 [Parastagonospora nodorum]
MTANHPELSPTQNAIRIAVQKEIVPIIQGSLVSALEIDDLTFALNPSTIIVCVDEEEEADGSTWWKVGFKHVPRIEVGENEVVGGEDEEKNGEKE